MMLGILIAVILLLASPMEKSSRIPFDLERPELMITLPKELKEISGLSYAESRLWAVQDEKGIVYQIDPVPPHTVTHDKFWKSGDFEGIEYVAGKLYMIKSNGNLYSTEVQSITEESTDKTDFSLPVKPNIEGLGYDRLKHRLIIADKGMEFQKQKGVYAFSLEKMAFETEPLYFIDEPGYKAYLQKKGESWIKRFAAQLSLTNYTFNPSAVGLDPLTNDIYMLSSPNAQLLVLDQKWKLRELTFLPRSLNIQPEGICFDQEGNLYISNEGKSGRGFIVKFKRYEGAGD